MSARYRSWGGYPHADHAVRTMTWRTDPLPVCRGDNRPVLPFGNGRSYGDVCLNDGGVLFDARPLDRIMAFDRQSGVLRCEAGVTLGEILELCVPAGWFLPVTPGTQFVTVGGAIANDVHGKNHHRAGAFGNHVRCFELARSDGSVHKCAPEQEPALFAATIGGLGLTGMIRWAEFQLLKASAAVDVETLPVGNLDDYLRLSAESRETHEYRVAWIDCLASGAALGRGSFNRANHAPAGAATHRSRPGPLRIPFAPPVSPLNRLTLRAFNAAKYHSTRATARIDGTGFFYPLDAVSGWNLLYGRKGFLQYQCVVADEGALRALLERIAASGTGSFLAVLKEFGEIPPRGMLSFCRPGHTLALDFPNRGRRTFELLDDLDRIVRGAGGAVYPAKDARMSASSFRAFFPGWETFREYVDPRFSSSFWRRVMAA